MSTYTLADPTAGDFAAVLAERTGVRLSAINMAEHSTLAKGADWLLADLHPAPLAGWWWVSVVEYGTGIVEFQRVPQAAPRVPHFLARMGVPAAAFAAEPCASLDYPPYDPPAVGPRTEPLRSVYFIQPTAGGLIKIGVATNPTSRLQSLQTGCPVELRILGIVPDVGQVVETELHQRFAASRVRGEWFDPTPDLVAYIAEHAKGMGD